MIYKMNLVHSGPLSTPGTLLCPSGDTHAPIENLVTPLTN